MHRRTFLQNAAMLTAGSLLFRQQAFASFFTRPPQLRMLRNNVGIFTERGGSIGVMLGKEGIVVIDSQFADTAPHMIEAVKAQSTNPFRYLLNTHHHNDHTNGNIALKGLVEGAVAHANAAANLKAMSEKNGTQEKTYIPELTFTDEWKLKLGDEKITGHYFGAGHTNGDAVYAFENSNVWHVGDLMFNKRHPFIDRSTGASISNWIKTLDTLHGKADKDTIIIFGHALNPGEEAGTREDLKKFSAYLQQLLSFAEAEVKKGVTREAFIAYKEIPGVTEWKGNGIERPLTAAYEEVTSRK